MWPYEDENVSNIDEGDGEGTAKFADGDAVALPTLCPNCNKMGEMRTAVTSIPHFKEILIMVFTSSIVDCGKARLRVGVVPTYGSELTLRGNRARIYREISLKGRRRA